MPEIDVLRGVAILVVVLYHGLYISGAVSPNHLGQIFINLTVFGWLGVNLFFVLSGFLITGILLASKQKPRYFRNFYFRRALRILPAYFAILLVLILLHKVSVRSTVVALLFLSNYMQGLHLVDGYWPLWSLSVEEQFYLLWPALVNQVSARVLAILCLGLCLVEPLLRWVDASGHAALGDIHLATYLIADNLALGALAAIFAQSSYGTLRNGVRAGLALCLGGGLLLLAGQPFGILHRTNTFGAVFQSVPWNLLFTGLLLLALGLRSSVFSSRITAPLRFLGFISYGLYLLHMLVNEYYDRYLPHLSATPVRHLLQAAYPRLLATGTISILIAWASRKIYEEPFLRFGRKASPAIIESSRTS
jgi:peptidoglycan/LPS O-acetylase OafA/YrhL